MLAKLLVNKREPPELARESSSAIEQLLDEAMASLAVKLTLRLRFHRMDGYKGKKRTEQGMGRTPCCDNQGLKKGPWTPEEDQILVNYIKANGHGSWRSLPKLAGLLRCGKSCRLRWANYLRPDIKRGPFTVEEDKSIIQLHAILGNKYAFRFSPFFFLLPQWSAIAAQLAGRTDNEVKNYWNTHLKKRLLLNRHQHLPAVVAAGGGSHMAQWESARLEAEARLSRESLLFSASAAAVSSSPVSAADAGLASSSRPEDFFLRIWNSDVGAAFRQRRPPEEAESKSCVTFGPPPAAAGMDVDSSGSNDVAAEELSDEAYQLYLDFAGDDLGILHGQLSTLFAADLNDSCFDSAFK
ncbi:hypothetical protein ZIOFF_014321 [Zingiber officinale]|uniref:Uncharacterized protein n=1 Tax=Zingiber officinale TaxID=94328 RepID=A0A8J5HH86_ZINOF|nr:hypothetical protein ZIOFF_014321 [Zingiber officinale]